ncbi:alpha/beta fold hydrolase [Kocuria palustris]|uniref:alpha/beta hydrolase family protein n=1 Tax=Kocuria TaxID=57493 RepID=UPI0006AA4B2B|nr:MULTISPECIES: alpha/beta fold hydrolase [Kocuria]ALB03287.1 lipase [Kocuria palustris]MBN6754142.1 alpha/beta fold hydrolase [Kocuria palustris]MBN6758249.1 alpha/beta fold hydrolase [Kocuria palustris]MBN6763277.1 alpha/beta fold hydrolase [Kocuria palustris]MBN6783325.1 alpha/beta fold hydrolase [Kocuria palustris]
MPESVRSSSRSARSRPLAALRGQPRESSSVWARGAVAGTALTVGAASLSFGVSSAIAAYVARQVVVPPRYRSEDLSIHEYTPVDRQAHPDALPGAGEVRLAATVETTVDGVYSLRFGGGEGHARIGEILSWSPAAGEVVREVQEVYSGDLSAASRGWWAGTVYPDPAAAGYRFHEVELPMEMGAAPCWVVPAGQERDPQRAAEHSTTARQYRRDDAQHEAAHAAAEDPAAQQLPGPWAIMVHGRGAQRMEAIRALDTAQRMGLTSLLISYRNDREAPASPDGRYGLGFTEWKDVQLAISYAKLRGATRIVLFGWSMGGAICLQTADLSIYRADIAGMVLTGPVVDWFTLFTHHTASRHIPSAITTMAQSLITSPRGLWLTGLAAPLDLGSLDWITRADQLQTPTLILHSADDEFVPDTASKRLAELNDRVEMVGFERARHTKEWNVDPQRWESSVLSWAQRVLPDLHG